MSRASAEHGLNPSRLSLDNGVVLLAQRNTITPAVAINATFTTGSLYEPDDRTGLAYVAALAIDRGTRTRSANAVAEGFDDRGVSLRTWTTTHGFTLSCVCLAEDFAEVCALLADIARHPVFPADEVEKRRVEAITSVKQDDDNPAALAAMVASEMLYGADHPYGRSLKGTVSSLERITREDLVAFHERALVPGALRVVVCGDVDAGLAADVVSGVFGDWHRPDPERRHVPPPPAASRSMRFIPMPGKSQTDIAYGFTTVRRLDPRYYAYWMMNHVLGQFGLGGRLADNIRERQGMAYYAYSVLDAGEGEGSLLVRAGVDPANVERTIDAIDREVRKLCCEGPTRAEFESTREALIGSIPRMLENNESIAEFLQTVEQFGLGLDFDRRLPALIGSVTLDQVIEAGREVLHTDRAAIAVAGPDIAADRPS